MAQKRARRLDAVQTHTPDDDDCWNLYDDDLAIDAKTRAFRDRWKSRERRFREAQERRFDEAQIAEWESRQATQDAQEAQRKPRLWWVNCGWLVQQHVDFFGKGQEAAINAFVGSVNHSEFKARGKSQILFLSDLAIGPYDVSTEPWNLRMTRQWLDKLERAIGDTAMFRKMVVDKLWVPCELAQRWRTAHGLDRTERLPKSGAAEPKRTPGRKPGSSQYAADKMVVERVRKLVLSGEATKHGAIVQLLELIAPIDGKTASRIRRITRRYDRDYPD